MSQRKFGAIILFGVLSLVVATCGTDDPEAAPGAFDLTEVEAQAVQLNAINQLGWTDVSPDEWSRLSIEACDTGAWETSVAAGLADRFLQDNGLTGRPGTEMLEGVIWLNLFVVCPDDVPDGAQPPAVLTG